MHGISKIHAVAALVAYAVSLYILIFPGRLFGLLSPG